MAKSRSTPGWQISLTGLLLLVASVAINIWLFRVSILMGIIGLNVAKHVLTAYLCQFVGLDRRISSPPVASPSTTSR